MPTTRNQIPSRDAWHVARLIALGYYDGPTEGVVDLGVRGGTYRFDMVASDADRDVRVIKLTPLPQEVFDQLAAILETELGPARWPIWVPRWEFKSDEHRRDVENRVNALYQAGEPVAVAACDDTLETCSRIKSIDAARDRDVRNWMAFLDR